MTAIRRSNRPSGLRHLLRQIILVSAIVLTARASAGAANARNDEQQVPWELAACLSWRDHLLHVVDWRGRTGTLDADQVTTITEVVDGLGHRCAGPNPREISRLFVELLDMLTEPESEF